MPLDDAPLSLATGRWHDCEILSEAMVLGLLLGYAVTPSDLFATVETRYASRLKQLKKFPMSWAM